MLNIMFRGRTRGGDEEKSLSRIVEEVRTRWDDRLELQVLFHKGEKVWSTIAYLVLTFEGHVLLDPPVKTRQEWFVTPLLVSDAGLEGEDRIFDGFEVWSR